MAQELDQSQIYINKLLEDLNLQGLGENERAELLEMLQQRLDEVVFNTTVRLLPEEQKKQYIQAAMDPDKNEQKIIEIVSQFPELADAIDAALLYEYEALKSEIGK